MPLTIAELQAEYEAARARLEEEDRRLDGRVSSVETTLRAESQAREDGLRGALGEASKRLDALSADVALSRTEDKSFSNIKIKEYVESVNASSARARGATYVLAVTSLVIFSAYWNVHPGSWLEERVGVAREAERFLTDKKHWPAPQHTEQKVHQALVEDLIERRAFDKPEVAKQYREQLENQLYIQSYQVKIPFFGVTYDINDLGMLGGFAFFVVLMILQFSLARELANLRLAFREAHARNELKPCFDLLSMSQVLTVPPHTGVNSNPFTRNLHKTLYLLPVLVHAMIVLNDLSTFDVGLTFSRFNTILTVFVSAAFFLLILILTYQCVHTAFQFDKTWRHQHERVEREKLEKEKAEKEKREKAPGPPSADDRKGPGGES